jgi:hypothetical protein
LRLLLERQKRLSLSPILLKIRRSTTLLLARPISLTCSISRARKMISTLRETRKEEAVVALEVVVAAEVADPLVITTAKVVDSNS